MREKKKLNNGLREKQKQSIKETESKLIKALDKQKHTAKINISKLARDSGISRPHIINKYSYLYGGRVSESNQVIQLNEYITELKNKNTFLTKKNTELEITKKELTNKLVELYTLIDFLKK